MGRAVRAAYEIASLEERQKMKQALADFVEHWDFAVKDENELEDDINE